MKRLLLTAVLLCAPSFAGAQQIVAVTQDDLVVYLNLSQGYQLCEIDEEGEGYALVNCKPLKTPDAAGLAALGLGNPISSENNGKIPESADEFAQYLKAGMGCRFDGSDIESFMNSENAVDHMAAEEFAQELMEKGLMAPEGDYLVLHTAGCQ